MCPALSMTNPEPSDCCSCCCGANGLPKNGSCGTLTTLVDVICTTPGDQRWKMSWIESGLLFANEAGTSDVDEAETIGRYVVSLPSFPKAAAPPSATTPPMTAAPTRPTICVRGLLPTDSTSVF